MEERWYLSREKLPSHVKKVEKELRGWDNDLRIKFNMAFGKWELWDFSERSYPYMMMRFEGNDGSRIVPGLGLSSLSILKYIRRGDNEVKRPGKMRDEYNEAQYALAKKERAENDDFRHLGRETRRYENLVLSVQVPDQLEVGR